MRSCLISLLLCFSVFAHAGCTQPKNGDTHKPSPSPVKQTKLEQIAFESFQKRDALRAQNLRSLKGVRFDAKRMAAIAEAGSKASIESWRPVAEELASRLDSVPQDDQSAFDAVLEELARAAERASK